jgi:hypothetical protein
MANTAVSVLLTDIKYDLKIPNTDTTRDNELISYMNRINKNAIMPALLRSSSDLGMKQWTTTETVVNVRSYSLPSDFVAFYKLWCPDVETTGALAAGGTSSVTLASGASSTDDDYNRFVLRMTSGNAADEQVTITDYTGSTRVASLNPSLSTSASTGDTYSIFKEPTDDDELDQLSPFELRTNYGTDSDGRLEAFAIDRQSNIIVGPYPDDTYPLYGLYFYLPSTLSATTDTMPYDPMFDQLVRQYTTILALNRDEYNAQFEVSIMSQIQGEIMSIIRRRQRYPGGVPNIVGTQSA